MEGLKETQSEREEKQRKIREARSSLIRLFGVLCIIIGMLTAIGGGQGMLVSSWARTGRALWGFEQWNKLTGVDYSSRVFLELRPLRASLLYFLLGILFLFSGAGMASVALWGRWLGIVSACYCVGLTVYSLFVEASYAGSFFAWNLVRVVFALALLTLLILPRPAREFSRS